MTHNVRLAMFLLGLLILFPFLASAEEPVEPVIIAFIGDTDLGQGVRDVYELIRSEGAHAVINGGDLSYLENPDGPGEFEALIDEILGEDFPYFATLGNHDAGEWRIPGGYSERFQARMQRIGQDYEGDIGVMSSLVFRGIHIIQVSPGLFELEDIVHDGPFYAEYLRQKADEVGATWRIASFHRNMNEMQLGLKGCDVGLIRKGFRNHPGDDEDGWLCEDIDETDIPGWEVYDASRQAGAIIATAHEHSYSRSHLFTNVKAQAFEPPAPSANGLTTLRLRSDDPGTAQDEGRSFVFVSGLGGKQVRTQARDGAWWAARYTSDQDGRDGALFGVFNFGGDPRRALFYFKDTVGVIVDAFFVRSHVGGDATITVDVEGAGGILMDPLGETYAMGQNVTLQAIPFSGNEADFYGFGGDVSGSETYRTVTVTEDLHVTASFRPSVSLVIPLDDEDDDAEEEDDGDVDTGDDDLDFEEERLVGVRFSRVDVPHNARILRAHIQFTAEEVESERAISHMYAEASGDSRRFDEEDEDLSERARTGGIVWDMGLWLEDQAGYFERSPNLASLVQEVVNREDWEEGNAMAFFFDYALDDGERDAVAADEEEDLAPTLTLEFLP